MWIDQRGSEVRDRTECQHLLTQRAGGIGRFGLSVASQVVIVPVNYQMIGQDVLIRVGPGDVLDAAWAAMIVAFEVDDVAGDAVTAWSVLVQGLATELDVHQVEQARTRPVVPLVPEPGNAFVRIRTGVLSGRRFPVSIELPS